MVLTQNALVISCSIVALVVTPVATVLVVRLRGPTLLSCYCRWTPRVFFLFPKSVLHIMLMHLYRSTERLDKVHRAARRNRIVMQRQTTQGIQF